MHHEDSGLFRIAPVLRLRTATVTANATRQHLLGTACFHSDFCLGHLLLIVDWEANGSARRVEALCEADARFGEGDQGSHGTDAVQLPPAAKRGFISVRRQVCALRRASNVALLSNECCVCKRELDWAHA